MRLDPSQERAAELIRTAPFGVVTGGPGTGKSTTLRTALDALDAQGQSYELAAPTGKAAKRMSEVTGRDARTIHRLLEYKPGMGWGRNRMNPLGCDLVVVDEASMLDVELAATLFDAVTDRTRVVLIGDANQLPSVGPGRVLADLVESSAVPVARLTTVHRAAAESWVCSNAPLMLEGLPLDLSPRHDFRFVEVESADRIPAAVGKLVQGEFQGAQVLAPQNTGVAGVAALNLALQATLNPPRDGSAEMSVGEGIEWKLGDTTFRAGDRVIQTKNDYKLLSLDGQSLGVFNGEVGEVESVDTREMIINFGDRRVPYNKGQAMALDLAYALTVHKSQGSEFPWALCIVHSSHTYMLTRQLVYTAITRAKKGVVIVGDLKGLHVALSGKKPPVRNTSLVEQMVEHGAEAIAAPAMATETKEEPKLPASVEAMGDIVW